MIKACVFDLGNTLMNDSKVASESLEELASILKEEGILQDEEAFIDLYREFSRKIHNPHWSHTYGEVEWFKRALNALGIREVKPEEVLERYRRLVEEKTRPDPDLIEAFKFLRAKRLKVALLSDERSARVEMFLRRTGMEDLFDAVVVSEEVGVEKPHPLIFETLRKRLKVKFSEIAIFGDDEVTDGGGKRLGMKFILVKRYKDPTWGWGEGTQVKPDYILERITKRAVEKCLKALQEGCREKSPAVTSHRDHYGEPTPRKMNKTV